MEHQLWKAIVALLATLGKPRKRRVNDFTDHDIVEVYYWAVIQDRPQGWACRKQNWPIHLRRRPLPAAGTLSRRLKTPQVPCWTPWSGASWPPRSPACSG